MNIIKPELDEIPVIFDIFNECRNYMEMQGIFQWDDIYPNNKVVTDDYKNNSIYIYKNSTEIMGVISFDEEQSEEYKKINWLYNDNKILVIHRLAVRPDYQKQGIARQLMNFVEGTAVKLGFSSVRLDTYSGNPRAIKFYTELGYKIRGEVFFARRQLPFYCMEKKLI